MKIKQILNNKMILDLPQKSKCVRGRKQYADKLSKKFQNYMLNIPEHELTVNEYKKVLYSIIAPSKPKIIIRQQEEDFANGSFIAEGKTSVNQETGELDYNYKKFIISFNLRKNKIISNQTTIVHETRHLIDAMCNPKTIFADCLYQFPKTNKIFDIANDIKSMTAPVKGDLTQKSLNKLLSKVDNESAIAILQDLRRDIHSEINAYSDAAKFEIKKMPLYRKLDSWLHYQFGYKKFLKLWKYLKIVESELSERLRSRHNS